MPPKKEQWRPAGKSPDDKLAGLSDGSESNATSRDTDGKSNKKKPGQAGNKGKGKDKIRRTQSDGQVGSNGNKKSSKSNKDKDKDKPWYGSPYDPRTDGLIVLEMRNPYDIGPIGPHRVVQIAPSQHAIDILGVYDAPRRPVTQTQIIGVVDVVPVRQAPQIVEVVPVFRPPPPPQIIEVVEYVPVPRAATYPVYNSWSDPYNYYTGDTYYY